MSRKDLTRSSVSTAYSIVSRTYKPQSAVPKRTASSGHRTGKGPRSRFNSSRSMTLSIRPDVGLSMQMSVLKPAVYLVPGLVISDFAAAHESGNGPERQFLDVRCGAALGGQADVAR